MHHGALYETLRYKKENPFCQYWIHIIHIISSTNRKYLSCTVKSRMIVVINNISDQWSGQASEGIKRIISDRQHP